MKNDNEKYEKELSRIKRNIMEVNKEIESINFKINKFEKEFDWLIANYNQFGVSGSQYDFDKADIQAEKEKLEKLRVDREYLSKRVDHNIESTNEMVEQEYHTLMNRKKGL
mmetsp:Transcript_2592/g.2222  ORF Transcript_2592/g.2222 Transcript_2592/m.2222 type:complete len:111 (+) Transcript_2592:773-1105(+)